MLPGPKAETAEMAMRGAPSEMTAAPEEVEAWTHGGDGGHW